MSDKIVVRFLKAWRGYSVDELAGFDPAVVEGLETKGFAEVYEGAGTGPKSKSAKKPASKPAEKKPVGGGDEKDPPTGTGGEGGEGGDGDAGAGSGASGVDDDAKP
ncbi:hypothetical protein ACI77J_09495 [Pseudomonas sp. O64]|uniref:hypothetical protein n=1 Tax=unclassified Pseudomonas TaxID=196821 RepID=UPI00387B0976